MDLTRRGLLSGSAALGAAALSVPGLEGRAAAAALPRLRGRTPRVGGFRVLSGSLHDHSTDSDGDAASEDVVAWLHAHRAELGIDFMTLSDHSDFFPLSPEAITTNPADLLDPWGRQAGFEQTYASGDFSFIRGFEWTNDQENHFNVLLSSGWTDRETTGDLFLSMTPFWTWFTSVLGSDGVGQFNHPGDKGALNWDDYTLNKDAMSRVATIEVHGGQGKADRGSSDAGWYWFALAQGWHVSPVMNWDYHDWHADGILANATPGTDYGENGHLPGQRSLVLARSSLRSDIRSALLARRTSATEIPDLWAVLAVPHQQTVWQGGTIKAKRGGKVTLAVSAASPTEPIHKIEVYGDNGVAPYPYYYGDNASWDGNHSQLTPSYIAQHLKYEATGGHATRKARIDTPPPGTRLAVHTLRKQATTLHREIEVTLPARESPRPDGAHFLYAVVYGGDPQAPARCWTGPILIETA